MYKHMKENIDGGDVYLCVYRTMFSDYPGISHVSTVIVNSETQFEEYDDAFMIGNDFILKHNIIGFFKERNDDE